MELPAVPTEVWEVQARQWAERVRHRVARERGLPCSVGAAVNKLQAKMASTLGKPAGVFALHPSQFLNVFGDQPVSVIPGVGPKTTSALAGRGVRTVEELSRAEPERLQSTFGCWGPQLQAHARGVDDRRLHARNEEPAPKSASHETTFGRDVSQAATLRATIWMLADRVGRRLRHQGFFAQTAAVKFKVGQARYSRQRVLERPTDEARCLALTAWGLLEGSRDHRALRLVGVAGMRLIRSESPAPLFPEDRKRQGIIQTGDRLRDRFGEHALIPAGALSRSEKP